MKSWQQSVGSGLIGALLALALQGYAYGARLARLEEAVARLTTAVSSLETRLNRGASD